MGVVGALNENDAYQKGCSKQNLKGYGTRPWQGHIVILGDGGSAFRHRTASDINKRAGNPPELNLQDAGEKQHCNIGGAGEKHYATPGTGSLGMYLQSRQPGSKDH